MYEDAIDLLPKETTQRSEMNRIRTILFPAITNHRSYLNALHLALTDKSFMDTLIWSNCYDHLILSLLARTGDDCFPRPCAPGARFVMILSVIRHNIVKVLVPLRERGKKKGRAKKQGYVSSFITFLCNSLQSRTDSSDLRLSNPCPTQRGCQTTVTPSCPATRHQR